MGLCVRLPDSRFCGLAALPYRDRRVGRSEIGAGDFCAHALASRVTRGTIIRDFLTVRDQDRNLTEAATRLSQEAFHAVWDNPDDAEYDRL